MSEMNYFGDWLGYVLILGMYMFIPSMILYVYNKGPN